MTFNVKKALNLYFICGTQNVTDRSLPDVLEEALDAGITCFQFREKGAGSLQNRDEIKEMALTCLSLCRNAGVPFVMNDDVEMALEIGADGVHVGQDDRPIAETIDTLDGRLFVGLSIHTIEEFKAAEKVTGLDYVGLGPVFSTATKADAKQPIGLERLEEIVDLNSSLPIVAIGGIGQKEAPLVRATGVAGISLISAIADSLTLKDSIQTLLLP